MQTKITKQEIVKQIQDIINPDPKKASGIPDLVQFLRQQSNPLGMIARPGMTQPQPTIPEETENKTVNPWE
jgi:hypothetical protein